MSETLTVVVDDAADYVVHVGGVALFSDEGLTTPVTFPQTISETTAWYAASHAGQRAVGVTVTRASDGALMVSQSGIQSLPFTVNATEGGPGSASSPAAAAGAAVPDPTTGNPGDALVVNGAATGYELAAPGASSAVAGTPVTRSYDFAFDTPGLAGGVETLTPEVGEILLAAWVEIIEPWDGTGAFCDVGAYLSGETYGWFGYQTGAINLLHSADSASHLPAPMLAQQGAASGPPFDLAISALDSNGYIRVLPAKFGTADPVKLVVTVDGVLGSAASDATQGQARLYLTTVIPDPNP